MWKRIDNNIGSRRARSRKHLAIERDVHLPGALLAPRWVQPEFCRTGRAAPQRHAVRKHQAQRLNTNAIEQIRHRLLRLDGADALDQKGLILGTAVELLVQPLAEDRGTPAEIAI